ncbi:hypothetical protein K440DRAFT_665207 [Wilcoxina mikolae CBS 423.85]|nr:hypothetical protein K440DRAFT_665207 [Wilcoxina mikolae CBS 423.85]
MGKHGPELPLLKCTAILTYWWYGKGNTSAESDGHHPSWIEVSTVFGVVAETAGDIVRRAIKRAKDQNEECEWATTEHNRATAERKRIADELKLLFDSVPLAEVVIEVSFDKVLEYLEDTLRPYKRQVIPKGSTDLQVLEEFVLKDKVHCDMLFPEIAKELDKY